MKTTAKHLKVVSFILSVIMLFSVVSITAFAADNDFAYYFADESKTTVYVTGFTGTIPDDGYVEIPGTVDGYTVVGIAEHTFDNMTALKGIIIPETVVEIDEDAFYGCNDIIDVHVKNSGEISVGEDVFNQTQWYEEHKQDYVISGTTLVSYKGSDEIVTVPYNCTAIADGAFKGNTAIKVVYIEKSLTKIGKDAFAGCTNLEKVVVGEGITSIDIGANAFGGTAWVANYPSTFVIIGSTLVKYNGSASYVSIPNVVTAIADGAFYVADDEKNIAFKVKVPISVKSFGDNCFYLYDSASDVYPAILVYKGSAAEDYCKKAGLNYTYAPMPGDVNLDGYVTAADARYALRISAKLESPQVSPEVKEAADLTGNGKIESNDARLILRISARLSEYTTEQFLLMPRTDYEILIAASQAISLAKDYGCAYSKVAYQDFIDYDMNLNTRVHLSKFDRELTNQGDAKTVTYAQDSKEAFANLYPISLIDADKIESYSCTLDDGTYNIKIVLKSETVDGKEVDKETFTEKMFPVVKVDYYRNALDSKICYDDFNFDMTYNNCTLEMKIDIDTMKLQSMTYTMNYDFSMTGKIAAIAVKNGDGGAATATRQDVIKYTNFVYFAN